MSYRYRVELKPLSPFFFGGEHTFGADEIRKEGSRYYAKSTLFPQQSAVLGMIRKSMLIEAGYMTMHKKGEWVDSKEGNIYDSAKRLCGDGAFSYEHDFDTGSILSISPIYIIHKGKSYTLESKDTPYEVDTIDSVSISLGNKHSNALFFDGYNPKQPHNQQLVSPNGNRVSIDEIFKTVDSVGIKKSQTGKTEDKAFFMKRSYQFDSDTLFATILETSEEIEWSQSFVTLGADQSPFMLTIKPYEDKYLSLFSAIVTPKKIDRVVALSDILIDEEAYNHSLFIFGNRFSVRYIARRGKKEGYKFAKSKRYYLFGRGSVIYSDNTQALKKALDKPYLQKVGLNYYIISKGEK